MSEGTVLVISVGGTYCMQHDPSDPTSPLTPRNGVLPEFLRRLRRGAGGLPRAEVLERAVLKDSSEMRMDDWRFIAHTIAERHADHDGFVVAHGTDAMCATACALTFLLEGLEKPVVLVGSIVPWEAGGDAERNFATALRWAARSAVGGVGIACDGVVWRGVRCVKSKNAVDAFSSPFSPPLGHVAPNGTVTVASHATRKTNEGKQRRCAVGKFASPRVVALEARTREEEAQALGVARSGVVDAVFILTYGPWLSGNTECIRRAESIRRAECTHAECSRVECGRADVFVLPQTQSAASGIYPRGVTVVPHATVTAVVAKYAYLRGSHRATPENMQRNLCGEFADVDHIKARL